MYVCHAADTESPYVHTLTMCKRSPRHSLIYLKIIYDICLSRGRQAATDGEDCISNTFSRESPYVHTRFHYVWTESPSLTDIPQNHMWCMSVARFVMLCVCLFWEIRNVCVCVSFETYVSVVRQIAYDFDVYHINAIHVISISFAMRYMNESWNTHAIHVISISFARHYQVWGSSTYIHL